MESTQHTQDFHIPPIDVKAVIWIL
jgi:hypothetical protein